MKSRGEVEGSMVGRRGLKPTTSPTRDPLDTARSGLAVRLARSHLIPRILSAVCCATEGRYGGEEPMVLIMCTASAKPGSSGGPARVGIGGKFRELD